MLRADLEERLEQLESKLRARGGRVTPQREAILRALLTADHPTIDQVYQQVRAQFPAASVVTVYRTFALLKELGDVLEVRCADLASHYDGARTLPHPHFVCRECGRTMDAPSSQLDSLVDTLTQDALGWELTQEVQIYGLCPDCRDADPASG